VIKLALPAGDLRSPLASALSAAGLHVEGYGEGSRQYRLAVRGNGEVTTRVFREKDIPIQIALGNYDLGVCNIAWVREMQARFPEQPVLPLADLGAGEGAVWAAAHADACRDLSGLGSFGAVRIASEYPNLAETFARAARLPRFRVQAVWGAAEAYPPEDADLVIVNTGDEGSLRKHGLTPLFKLLDTSAWLIGNARALAGKDLSPVLGPLAGSFSGNGHDSGLRLPGPIALTGSRREAARDPDVLRMAVPDGHQQRHVVAALHDAGLKFEGYDESTMVRRPESGVPGLEVKVIRPHDMPSLVATGEIDLAITGRDCLNEHLYSFPSSPAREVADLRRGQYNLSAVVSEEMPATTIGEALALWRSQGKRALRVAAEFPATGDHYARSRHFWRYQVIPIAGASEGFVPEDADLLIEGTETGRTIAENKLKVIDLIYRSTTCAIARGDGALEGRRKKVFDGVVGALRTAAEAREAV
jgi:ATP phosphoribosyltransferase